MKVDDSLAREMRIHIERISEDDSPAHQYKRWIGYLLDDRALLTPTEDDERIARELYKQMTRDAILRQNDPVQTLAQALAAKGARQREDDAKVVKSFAGVKGIDEATVEDIEAAIRSQP